MKKTLLLILIPFYSLAFSQSENDIAYIRAIVEKTNTELKNYNTAILKNKEQIAAEGNEIAVYTIELDKIKLIKETFSGKMGKTIIWNYIDNNQPIFVFKEFITYQLPVSDKNFNSKEFSKKEERIYFKDSRIIRWMIDKKQLKKFPSNAAVIENNMNESISAMIAQFKNENVE